MILDVAVDEIITIQQVVWIGVGLVEWLVWLMIILCMLKGWIGFEWVDGQ